MRALDSGLMFTILAVAYLATSMRAPTLTATHGRRVLAIGALALAAGHALLLGAVLVVGTGGSVFALTPGLILAGAGIRGGLVYGKSDKDAGYPIESLVVDDPMEAAGVNDRHQLAVAEAELRDRINERWMRRGVTMWDPERTYVDAEVQLATDVSLLPGVILRGRCVVGEGSEIGPNANLVDTTVGQRATVSESTCERATIGDGAQVGPFCVLRPGAEVPERAVVPPHTVVEGPEA